MWENDDYIKYNAIAKTTCEVYLQLCKIIAHQINSMCKCRRLERGAERNTIILLTIFMSKSLNVFSDFYVIPYAIFIKIFLHIFLISPNKSEVTQSCPTLCNPTDYSLPGFSLHGILQAGILEWVAISFSRGSSQPRDRTPVSCIAGRCFNL